MRQMREPRYLATSVLNGDGNMWVLGGYNDNNPKKASIMEQARMITLKT